MKNIPRIFIDKELKTGAQIPLDKETAHYLSHVMRTHDCLCFHSGTEFNASLGPDGKTLVVLEKTAHNDPSNDITLAFAPVKRIDDLINMATQMGVKKLQPVITERTVAHHVNWKRMRKIATEAAEQSNRNSVPEIAEPLAFRNLDFQNLAFADERAAYGKEFDNKIPENIKTVLIGPEGGFSNLEFGILDSNGAIGISLGKTILRAEVAAVVAIEKIRK